jgi:hypothetical protein
MNLFKSTFWSRLAAVLLLAVLSAVSGCATVSNQAYHSFSFDGWSDNPAWSKQVDLLEYSYGDKYPKVRDVVQHKKESLPYGTGVTANMTPGEFLFVKWRIKTTGEEIEVKVDLRSRLPENMFDHRLTFVIDGKQLYVYLVTPQVKKTDAPPLLKTTHSRYYVTYEIYPSNTYKK